MESYVVIGLGRFGTHLAARLFECGQEVLAIDPDEQKVNRIADQVTRAVAADARDRDVLDRLGVENCDRAIVAVGSDLASAALITMNLKALKVPYIMCKAQDATYKEILEKLGADRVIIPEWDIADRLALGLTSSGAMEYIELSQEVGIVEMQPAAEWVGKTVRQLEMRSRYGLNLLAVRREDQIIIPPDIDTPLDRNEILVLLGKYESFSQWKPA